MGSIELPFLDVGRDRHGRPKYYYFRRHGMRWELPSDPASEEFAAEYQRLLKETEPGTKAEAPADRRSYVRGQFGAVINDYLATGEFKTNLAARTQTEYTRVCEELQEAHGHKRVRHLQRRHVRQIRDEKAETPGAANTRLRMLKILLNFAVDDGVIDFSPAAKMKELKVGEWRA